MNKLKVFTIITTLILLNFAIIRTHNLIYLIPLSGLVFLSSFYLNLFGETYRRLKFFVLLGIFIIFFQLFFGRGLFFDRFLLGLKVVVQLVTISESMVVAMKLISPSEIMNALNFLPKTAQILVSTTFYFIPMVIKEYSSIQIVQQSRGLGETVISKIFYPVYILIPLLHATFKRSQTITYTILSRGFHI